MASKPTWPTSRWSARAAGAPRLPFRAAGDEGADGGDPEDHEYQDRAGGGPRDGLRARVAQQQPGHQRDEPDDEADQADDADRPIGAGQASGRWLSGAGLAGGFAVRPVALSRCSPSLGPQGRVDQQAEVDVDGGHEEGQAVAEPDLKRLEAIADHAEQEQAPGPEAGDAQAPGEPAEESAAPAHRIDG